jgi:hypothetical protein
MEERSIDPPFPSLPLHTLSLVHAQGTRAFLQRAVPEHADNCTIEIFGVEDAKHRKVLAGTAAVGKLIITAPRAVPVATMLQNPFFICAVALAGEAHSLPKDKERGLPYIQAAVRDGEGWRGALVTWAAAQDAALALAPSPSLSPPSTSWSERVAAFLDSKHPAASLGLRFRASAVRDGEHAFRKPEVMPVVGAGVAARLGEAALVNLTQFDLEVVALIIEQVGAGGNGMNASSRCLFRPPTHPPTHPPTRPSPTHSTCTSDWCSTPAAPSAPMCPASPPRPPSCTVG